MTFFYASFYYFFKSLFFLIYRHRVYGVENIPKGGGIIASSHASFLDPLLVGVSAPETVHSLAKASLFKPWGLRWVIRKLHSHPVTGSVADRQSFRIFLDLLQDDQKMVIFPEGLRSWDGEIESIKPGVVMLATRANVPIIPTYLHGTFDIWPRTRKFPKPFGKTACVFGKPLYPKDFEGGRREAQEKLRQALGDSLAELKVWYENQKKTSIDTARF